MLTGSIPWICPKAGVLFSTQGGSIMSKKRKRLRAPEIPAQVDLNVLCDLIILTDAYRSGHRLDYAKMKDAIKEGKLGKNFSQKEWPIIRKAIHKADEARSTLAEWNDETANKIRDRKKYSVFLGYIFLPVGIVLLLIPFIFEIQLDISFAIISIILGVVFLMAGYIYYRIRLSEYIDIIFTTEFPEGQKASTKLKEMTQELINSLRNALKSRYDRGIYTEIRDVELELFNIDYNHIKFRGVVSRVRRRKKVYVEVE
jgi:hypothetical protein